MGTFAFDFDNGEGGGGGQPASAVAPATPNQSQGGVDGFFSQPHDPQQPNAHAYGSASAPPSDTTSQPNQPGGGGGWPPAPAAPAAPPNQQQGGFLGQPQPPAPPSNSTSQPTKEAIQNEFEELMKKKLELVERGGKQLEGGDVHQLFNLIYQGATTFEHEWTGRLLVGSNGKNFATILGALERGVKKEMMQEYMRCFLRDKNLTLEQLRQQVEESAGETLLSRFGFGKNKAVYETLKYSIQTFSENDENVAPPSNLPPVNPNPNLTPMNLFGDGGAPQGTAPFNHQPANTETAPPFNAPFSSSKNQNSSGAGAQRFSSPSRSTSAAPGSLFGQGSTGTGTAFANSQGGQRHYAATPSRSDFSAAHQTHRSELQGQGTADTMAMNVDTPAAGSNVPARGQNGSAVPPGGWGGYASAHPNTNAPPAFVATSTEDPSVASNVTQSTFGGFSAPIRASAAATTGPPSVSAASAPETPTSKGAATRDRNKRTSALSRGSKSVLQTPKHNANGLARRPPLNATGRRRDNRSDNQNFPKTPGRREVKKQIGTAKLGETPLEDIFDSDHQAVRDSIVVPDKASVSDLMLLRDYFPEKLKALSDKGQLESLFGRVKEEPEFFLRLKIVLNELKNHPSTQPFLQKILFEKENVQLEQERVTMMANQITQSSCYGTSYTRQLIEQKRREADAEKERLNRLIAEVERKFNEDADKLRYNAKLNESLVDDHLETLEEIYDEVKNENASRLAMPLALEKNDDAALDLLSRAIDIRDGDVDTSEEFKEKYEKDKEAFFEHLALIENGDMQTLIEQALKLLYGESSG